MKTGNKPFVFQWRSCSLLLPCLGGNTPLSLSTGLPQSLAASPPTDLHFPGSGSPYFMDTADSPTCLPLRALGKASFGLQLIFIYGVVTF